MSTTGEAFTMRLRGVAGLRFHFERTTDYSSWSELISGRGEDDVWQTTDDADTAGSFYRAVIEE